MAKKAEGAEDYGDEEEEDEDGSKANKEPPTLPKFDEEEFLIKWDEENPDIEISGECTDDINNDWVLTEEEMTEQIAHYWTAKQGE